MPYDPTPMGDEYYPSIKWDEQGKPYNITKSGKRNYIPPASAATEHADNPVGARLIAWAKTQGATPENPGGAGPQGGFASNKGTWKSDTGTWDKGNFLNTSLGGLLLGGGAMAAPLAVGALAGGAGGAATIPTTLGIESATSLGLPVTAGLGTAGAATTAAAAGAGAILPSTPIGTGAMPALSGAVPIGPAAVAPAASTPSLLMQGLTDSRSISAGINAGTGLLGTYLSNRAAQNAANTNADALKYQADLADAQNKRAELFARQQAENQWLNAEITRQANYNQWAAREGRVSSLGQAMGLSARDIPTYAPGTDPRYTNDGTAPPPGYTPPGATPTGTTTGQPVNPATAKPSAEALAAQFGTDPVTTALIDYYGKVGKAPTGEGSGPTDLAYFRKRINETGGLTPDNLKYWFGDDGSSGRIAKELAGAVPAENAKPAYQAPYGTQDFQFVPYDYSRLAPALQAPQPGSLGALTKLGR